MRRVTGLLIAAMACVVALASGASAAVAGGIDPSYGEAGVVRPAEGTASTESEAGVGSFGPVTDGSVYVLYKNFECPKPGGSCDYAYSLGRYDSAGRRDEAFGVAGTVALPSAFRYSVTDNAGAALLVGFAGKGIVLRRFTVAGAPDASFGDAGVARVACACGAESHLHVLVDPDGKILLDVDRSSRGYFYENGTLVRLIRLLPGGAVDRAYGTKGTVRFKIRGPGAPTSAVAAADDATLIGGSGFAFEGACCGERNIYLRRVTADGRLDQRFDRNATQALKPLEIRGRFPILSAVVDGDEGAISVLGYAGRVGGGYDLRLRPDGRPASDFGNRGVRRLPFTVRAAVGGIDGAVFAVGALRKNPYGYLHAFRILANGGLDPAYHRGQGLKVPSNGSRLAVTALGEGLVMVTDNGNHYCREVCPNTPTMARFLE